MNPWASAPDILVLGVPNSTANPAALTPGGSVPVAASANGDAGIVAYLRRRKDGSYHYEVARLRRETSGDLWEVETVGGSSYVTASNSAGAEGPTAPIHVIHHVAVAEEGKPLALHELFVQASPEIRHLRIDTDYEIVQQAVTSPWGFCALIAHTHDASSPIALRARDGLGREQGLEIGGRPSLRG